MEKFVLKKLYIYIYNIYSLVHNCLAISVCKGRRVVVEYYCSLTPLTCSISKPGVGQVSKMRMAKISGNLGCQPKKNPKAWRLIYLQESQEDLSFLMFLGGTDK
jgi:hypothetical protein